MLGLIMIVEDERDLVTTLEYNLKEAGFTTRAAFTGDDAMRLALVPPLPDLIVLDLMLPKLNGIEVCRRLKANENTRNIPVLILSARGDEIDKVEGFSVGADDYLVKPFRFRELILRIKAILKRTKPTAEKRENIITFGPLTVDLLGHKVSVDKQEVSLTRTEFKLLINFLKNKGNVRTRDTLLDEVWGYDREIQDRTVDVHIRCLREKLKQAGSFLETIRGVGYRFRDTPPAI